MHIFLILYLYYPVKFLNRKTDAYVVFHFAKMGIQFFIFGIFYRTLILLVFERWKFALLICYLLLYFIPFHPLLGSQRKYIVLFVMFELVIIR